MTKEEIAERLKRPMDYAALKQKRIALDAQFREERARQWSQQKAPTPDWKAANYDTTPHIPGERGNN